MKRSARSTALLGAFAIAASGLAVAVATPVRADLVPQALPLAQDWSNTALITVDDDWSGVPGFVGYQGGATPDLATGTDPRTVVAAAPTAVDVFANLVAPSASGGVAELELSDPVVALQGSGTADAPNLVLAVSTVGAPADTVLSYVVRDVDSNADNAVQPFAAQYRIGTTADWSNLPGGYLADASVGGATQSTPVALPLPADALGEAVVQFRFLTTNAVGSDEWLGIDDIEIGPPDAGPAPPVATCPAALTVVAGDGGTAAVSATDADSAIVDIAITSAPVDGIGLTTVGPGQATLAVAPTVAAGTYPVTITFTADDGATATCGITVTVAAVTRISTIQGTGAASLLVGQPVIVDAVVTSLFTNQDLPDGFFVEEEDADHDTDEATSEGVFVFCRGSCPAVVAGDLVRLRGTVAEFFEMTQVDVRSGSVEVRASGQARPTAEPVELPAATSTRLPATFERVEGMVVTFAEDLTVAEHFELARYGQLRLTSDGRTYQFTHDNEPDVPGFAAHVEALNRRTIILDDDNNDQNDAVTGPADEPYPYPSPGLSTSNDLRAGDTVTGLTGVLHYSFAGQTGTDAWRIRPIPGAAYTFEGAARPASPEAVGGRIKVAAFNVLNYFTTIDETASTSTGPCAPSGTLDCRGADSLAELERQRAKEVAAIGKLDADVVGLIELQNDDGTAVRDLIAGLNARPGAAPYTELPTGTIGGDAIKVTFIYRASRVTPTARPFSILDSTDDPRFIDNRNRPALIQEFQEVTTGERFTAAVNHLKSKGSACTPDDPDLLDGQGNCNATRTNAAAALADHIAGLVASGWDRDVIIIGDLNSYRSEDPITMLESKGYIDLIDAVVGPDAYSYLFDGQLGYLDHALGTTSMKAQVTGVTEWHVNADEVPLFDYNDTIRDVPGEAAFERESAVGGLDVLYAPDERRSSDHDPLLVGLDLASLTIDDALIVQSPRGGGTVVLAGTTGAATATCPTLSLRVDTTVVPVGRTTQVGRTTRCISLTSRGLVTFDRRTGAFAAVLVLPSTFRLGGDAVTFVLTVGDTTYGVVREGRRNGLVWTSS